MKHGGRQSSDSKLRLLLLATVMLLANQAISCGMSQEISGHADAAAKLDDAMRMRNAGLKRVRSFANLAELTRKVGDSSRPSPADSIVVGNVVGVEKLAGYAPAPDDGATTVEFSYDDPHAQWKSVRLVVDVTETIAGTATRTTQVGLAVDAGIPFNTIRAALLSYGDVVLPLTAESPVFASHPELFAIVDDGELFIDLQGDRLVLPFLEPNEAKTLLASVTNLSSLRSAASAAADSADNEASAGTSLP